MKPPLGKRQAIRFAKVDRSTRIGSRTSQRKVDGCRIRFNLDRFHCADLSWQAEQLLGRFGSQELWQLSLFNRRRWLLPCVVTHPAGAHRKLTVWRCVPKFVGRSF